MEYTKNDEKRIYSLNLLAYLAYKTNIRPDIHQDNDGKFYGLMPETRGVAWAINAYRKDDCFVELHKFLQEYKNIRDVIKEMRGV